MMRIGWQSPAPRRVRGWIIALVVLGSAARAHAGATNRLDPATAQQGWAAWREPSGTGRGAIGQLIAPLIDGPAGGSPWGKNEMDLFDVELAAGRAHHAPLPAAVWVGLPILAALVTGRLRRMRR